MIASPCEETAVTLHGPAITMQGSAITLHGYAIMLLPCQNIHYSPLLIIAAVNFHRSPDRNKPNLVLTGAAFFYDISRLMEPLM